MTLRPILKGNGSVYELRENKIQRVCAIIDKAAVERQLDATWWSHSGRTRANIGPQAAVQRMCKRPVGELLFS
ncbi:hypothetical protein [Paraburkholderia phytofirmans]|uniref:Uncharacterized protein n=1 Tax=Paraburkholderia phytofirmans TaxID=261302 RepID=A0ABW9BH16_9BURK